MFQENVPLKKYSSFQIGGSAKYFFEAQNLEEIKSALREAQRSNLPIFILAGGTNLLIKDEGFEGLVLHPNLNYIEKINKTVLRVGCGVEVGKLLEYLIENELSGMEWAGGLPGSLGGAVRGNAGAFNGEIKNSILNVTSLILKKPDTLITRNNDECRFGYRNSVFKEKNGEELILEVHLEFRNGSKNEIKKAVDEKIAYRFSRHPMERPNIGSMFKNVLVVSFGSEVLELVKDKIKNDPIPVIPTAVLLARCNLVGVTSGGAQFSPKHPNFIVNVFNAKASDVENLIALAKGEVYKKFKVNLEEEIVRV